MKYFMKYNACVRNTEWNTVYLSENEEIVKVSDYTNAKNSIGLFVKKIDNINSGMFELNISSVRQDL